MLFCDKSNVRNIYSGPEETYIDCKKCGKEFIVKTKEYTKVGTCPGCEENNKVKSSIHEKRETNG